MQTENTYVETDLGNIAFNPRGEYSDETSYEYLDTVSYKGGSYVCLAELAKTTSGIAPEPGKNTEHWQMLTLPGGLTSDYIAMHDDVANKAKQVETSRTAVELSQQEVEAAQADVSQMWQDTQEASEEAAASRDSAAGYAQSAEASRTAAAESEQNINAQVTGFDTHVAEKTSAAESAIIEARQTAVNTVSAKQGDAVQAVTGEGNKQIKNVEDAGTEQVGKAKSAGASAVSAAGAAGMSAVNAVKTQQTASIKAVADEGAKQVGAVDTAGTTQVNAVNTAGKTQVEAVNAAGDAQVVILTETAAKELVNLQEVAEQFKDDHEQISSLTEDTAVLQKRQNVLIGSEIGNPVRCDDAFAAPLCGLNVYGNSTQDGTPSPDNPVPIVSAGDGGIVVVRVTGKNLIQPYTKNTRLSKNGATMDYDVATQLVHIYGTTTGLADLYSDLQQIPFHVKSAVTMSLTEVSGNIPTGVTVQYSDFATLGLSCTASKPYDTGTFNRSDAPGFLRFTVNIPEGLTFDCLFKVQLELGVTATTYEPYHEQTLTLSTPNGLPGIPVTSGGNYTDQNGQQWVCDKVDLERGVNVQRVDKTAFDSTKTLAEQNAILTTPIETPLTPAEIAAYKALTAYGPDTVVQAGDGAGVRLDYQRDVNIAIKRIEDAVASIT